MNKRVNVISADDWVAVYVDGEAVHQEHDIVWIDMMKLSQKYEFTIDDIHSEYIEDFDDTYGSFPQKLEDLKKIKRYG